MHPKNALRREAIDKNEYRLIVTEEDADKYFGELLSTCYFDEVRQRKNEMEASLEKGQKEGEAMKFAAT